MRRRGSHLQVDNFPKFAEVLVKSADVVELRRDLTDGQLGVGQRKWKWHFLMVAMMVGLVEVQPVERK